jgi:hypothetical protein
MWIAVEPRHGLPVAEAGWKLHVSASTRTAVPTLRIAVAVLRAESVAFKAAASVERLEELNHGRHGLSQIGKFVTVYAEDAAAARRIGFALARALRGQAGPRLRYERRVARDAPVWYRFGSFRTAYGLSAHGSLIPLLLGGAEPIADRRDEVAVPRWAEADPFDGGDDADPAASVVGGRFVALRTMASSYKTDVFDAVDLHGDGKVTCILKRAHAETVCDTVHDAIALLRREHDALERIAFLRIAPMPLGFFEADGDAFLAMTLEPGVTLDHYVATSRALGRRLDDVAIERFADTLVATVDAAHGAGIAHRDLKGANLVVRDDGALRILDWDASAALDDPAFPRLATYGYTTGIDGPVASDVRGAASVVAALATGIDASRLPDPARLADALDRMREDLSASFRAAIRDALTQPQQFSSLAAWREAAGATLRSTQSTRAHHAVFPTDRELTRTVQWLVAAAHDTPDGVAWVSGDRERFGASLRDLYGGVAGIALVLDAAGTALGCGDALACAERARSELRALDPDRHAWHPGLLIGESGVGLVLLASSQRHGNLRDREIAFATAHRVAQRVGASPDIANGDAGILHFLARMYREGHDPTLRDALAARAHALIEGSAAEGGLRWWRSAPDVPTFGGEIPLGYAHGVAGIADALLDAGLVLDQTSLLDAVREAAAFLRSRAVDGEDGMLTWPNNAGEIPSMIAWCHGAAGIARFFLRLSAIDASALDVAIGAAKTVAAVGDGLGATWCHGLGGAIETLLDVGAAAGESRLITAAHRLAKSYDVWRRDADDRTPLWVGDDPFIVTPDAFVGVAGVVATMLRLLGAVETSVLDPQSIAPA